MSQSEVIIPDTEILQTGLVTGIVTDEYDQPIADYTIELYVNGQMLDQVRTNTLGQYEIEAPIKEGQDMRLFATAPGYRESLRRITFQSDQASINFPVSVSPSYSVPSIAPGDQNLIAFGGFIKDPNGDPARGYVNIHDRDDQTNTVSVDMLSRTDINGYYEVFIPKDKILNLEMVERCDEEGMKIRREIGSYFNDVIYSPFITTFIYDKSKTYRVTGNFTNCEGGSLNQFHLVTYTLNETAVDAPFPSSHLFFYDCNTPVAHGESINFFLRDRQNRKRSEVMEISASDYLIDYGNISACLEDPQSLTLVYEGKTFHFEGINFVRLVDFPSETSVKVTNYPGEITNLEIKLDVSKQAISSIQAFDKNGQIIIDLKNMEDVLRFDFFEKDRIQGTPTLEAGMHPKGDHNVSVNIYTYQ